MGITSADNIDFLNEAKKLFEDIANNPSINETVKAYFTIESLESAMEIMRKYQKIKQILDNWENNGEEDDPINIIDNIEEVLEDGND